MVTVGPSISSSWTVCGGSLSDSVTVEDSSTTDPDPLPISKTPLVLLPPDSSPPCEITLKFGERREVQQVYLRSTARVYEVYYSPDQKSPSPEYLCTVRCSRLAAEEADKINLTASCEDGWVDVKVPRSSPESTPSLNDKDFYEATAQISDADPCISITIRLLSIQSGDRVFVYELYVFAEPVVSSPDVDDDRKESTAGNSLMTMLVPTLLQLSRSGLANRVQGALAGDRKDGPGFPDVGFDGTQPDLPPKLSTLTQAAHAEVSDVHSSAILESPCEQVLDKKSDTPCCCSDTILKDLLSRVSGIERICLRFEENMLRPLSSIESRLAQVEAQLEAMNQSSRGHGFNKFSTPDFLPGELNLNAFSYSICEDFCLEEGSLSRPSIQPDKTSDPGGAGIYTDSVLPLGPSGGENDCGADSPPNEDQSPEEKINQVSLALSSLDVGDGCETYAPQQDDESSKAKAKQAMSVDEALAFALDRFVSSIPSCSVKHTSCFAVKAPDVSPVDDEPHEEKSLVPSRYNDIDVSSTHWTDDSECTKDSHTTALSPHDEAGVSDCPFDKYIQKAGEEQDELPGPSLLVTFDDYWRTEAAEGGETIAEKSSVLSPDDAVPLEENHLTQATGSLCHGEEANLQGSKMLHGKDENIMGATGDRLDSVLSFSRAACVVDFESSILDVKFISEERSYTESALESLWSNAHEANGGPSSDGKSNDLSLDVKQEYLIVVDDGEAVTCSTDGIDHCYCGLLDMPDEEDVKASFQASSNDDMLAGSLI